MDDAASKPSARGADGRFGPGNPGRPLGSRNRMSRRIALGLMHHYAAHESEILERLTRFYFADFVRLIGRMLPRGPAEDAVDLESLPPQEVAHITRAVRHALNRVEVGEGTLAEVEAALVGAGIDDADR